MTALTLHLAYTNWLMVHQAIHGILTQDEQQIAHELLTFLTDVARAEETCGCDEASILADAARMQRDA